MTKAALRKFYLNERLSLTEPQLAGLNAAICENFLSQLDLADVNVVHSFVPMEKTNEPDTWRIIHAVKKKFPHIRFSLPKINVKNIEIDNFYFEGTEQLKVNEWGIPEPQYGERTASEEIDLVLVPMVIADQYGHRVGYGKGFYDKFLSTCKSSCKSVGLCFYEPIHRIEDVTTLDVPLKFCATPIKVHRFQ